MESVNPLAGLGAVEFVETAARQRAAIYRERAAHLRAMARAEPDGRLRAQLADLAGRYAELSAELDTSRKNARSMPHGGLRSFERGR